jgi:protein-S-isoprenylcysteine O-methyltransferase Ste14
MINNSALVGQYFNCGMSSALAIFLLIVSTLVSLGVFAIFVAVLVDFIETKGRVKKKVEKKSLVATFSMTLFFVLMYLLIRLNIGFIRIDNINLNIVLIAVGLILFILGVIVNIAGRIKLGRNWSNQVRIYEGHKLVCGGVFSLVRHPLYASLIWMFIGAALIYGNVGVLIGAIVVFIPAMRYRAKIEEKYLSGEFSEYTKYRENVAMFFPVVEKLLVAPKTLKIDKKAIVFCRLMTVVLLVLSYTLSEKLIVVLVFALFVLSTATTIKYAPSVMLYNLIFGRLLKRNEVEIDTAAIRFAQGLGSLLLFLSLLNFYYYDNESVAWIVVSIVGVSTLFGASGLCIGARIYYYLHKRELI